MYSVGRIQTWHTGCAKLVLLEDGGDGGVL